MQRLDLGLYSHPKEFGGNGVRTHVNSKGKKILPQGGSNPGRRIKQDSEPNTLPTSYSGSLKDHNQNPLQEKNGSGNTQTLTSLTASTN